MFILNMEDAENSSPHKFRPPSLSIVTLTSDDDEPPISRHRTNRSPSLATLRELRIDLYSEVNNMDPIEEVPDSGAPETPTVVIDECESIRNNDLNNNDKNNSNSIFFHNGNAGIKQDNYPSPQLIKYLLEPPTERRVKNGSVCSSVSGRPASILKHRDNEDNVSIGGCSIGGAVDDHHDHDHDDNAKEKMKERLVEFLSIMYAIFLVVIGAMVALGGMDSPVNDWDHVFSIVVTLTSVAWIGFIHWDIQKYKKWAIEYLKPETATVKEKDSSSNKSVISDNFDGISLNTAVIFNTYNKPIDDVVSSDKFSSAYRFSHGKHSGNFYLKCGMTVFCMGSIIHQGLNLAQQAHYFNNGNHKCQNSVSLLVYLIRCVASFYQLYFVFKYSNILINRYKILARFALMHLVGTSLSFWVSTIIEEAVEGYVHKVKDMSGTINYTIIDPEAVLQKSVKHYMECWSQALINSDSMDAIPYLYPFTIEYNIILASVWYIVWTNVGTGNNDTSAKPHQLKREFSEDASGTIDVNYKSTLSINADCHASNLGLFGGLLTLLAILTTIVIFFTTIKQSEFKSIGVGIFTVQIGTLMVLSAITVPLAYRKIVKLDIVNDHHLDNPATAMDDLLVLIPLPFYYVYYVLAIRAEASLGETNSIFLVVIYIVTIVQVSIQTPMIVDGIRRCSNSRKLRFKKPGRGLVTFSLILNISAWILITFEIKQVDKYHSMTTFYGKLIWMIISDTCLPMMLFYRFHCSVCLSDIWKHAYEKDETHFH